VFADCTDAGARGGSAPRGRRVREDCARGSPTGRPASAAAVLRSRRAHCLSHSDLDDNRAAPSPLLRESEFWRDAGILHSFIPCVSKGRDDRGDGTRAQSKHGAAQQRRPGAAVGVCGQAAIPGERRL